MPDASSGIAYAEIRADISKLDADLEIARGKIQALVTETRESVQIGVTADTTAAGAQLTEVEAQAQGLSTLAPTITPLVDGEPAVAAVSEIEAAIQAGFAAPAEVVVVADTAPAIASLEAIQVEKELAAVPLIIPVVPIDPAVERSAGGLLQSLRGVSAGARDVGAIMNGNVSAGARSAGRSMDAAGSSAGLLGLGIGVLALAVPHIISALSGMKSGEDEVKIATDTVSAALDKNTDSLLKNKDALKGIKTESDAAKAAQDQIDQSLLSVASKLDGGAVSADQMGRALGSLNKSPVDLEPIIASIQNVTKAQIDAQGALMRAGSDSGGFNEAAAKHIIQAQQILTQIGGFTDVQVKVLANLSQANAFSDDAVAQFKKTAEATGLSKDQVNLFADSLGKLTTAANATDLSNIIDQALQTEAGTNDAFAAALHLAEIQTKISRTTSDAAQAQKLYAATILIYKQNQDAANDATDAAEKAQKKQTDTVKDSTKALLDNVNTTVEEIGLLDKATGLNVNYADAIKETADAAKKAAEDEKKWNDAIASLSGPAKRASEALSFIKDELDALSHTKLDLDQATEEVTRFFADLADKTKKDDKFNIKFGFETTTVGGSNNFDILTKGLDGFKKQVVASFAKDGDVGKAVSTFSADIAKLKVSFIAGGKTPAEKAKLGAEFDAEIAALNLTPAQVGLALQAGTADELASQIDKLPDSLTKIKLGALLDAGKTAEVTAGLNALINDPTTGQARVAQIYAHANGLDDTYAALTGVTTGPNGQPYIAPIVATPAGIPDTQTALTGVTVGPNGQPYLAPIVAVAHTADADIDLANVTNAARTATINTSVVTGNAIEEVNAFIRAQEQKIIDIGIRTRGANEAGGYYQSFRSGGMPHINQAQSHYNAGSQNTFMYGEPGTLGEFFISMKPEWQDLNRDLVRNAASRLGMDLNGGTSGVTSQHLTMMLGKLSQMVDRLSEIRDMPPMFVNAASTEPNHVASKMHWATQARRRHFERVNA